MDSAAAVIAAINDKFWYLIIVLLVVAGVWFSFRTLVVQIRQFPEMLRTITERPTRDEHGDKGISAFKAFSISAASRVGTGNVAGVAVAIVMGGPGAVFWMWLLAIIGGATAFVESTLAQLYKVRGEGHTFKGGPAYYIRDALGKRGVAITFAVLITITYGFVFNAVQANSISAAVQHSIGNDSMTARVMIGVALALVTGIVTFGGVRRVGAVTEYLVPIMATAYLGVAAVVVIINIDHVPAMIGQIIGHALGFTQITGAAVGTAIMQGMKRGLFSNEAGMGSVPNAAATADVSHPVKQGLVQALGVYFDTLVVCSATAFVILLSDPTFGGELTGVELTQTSLQSQVGDWAGPFLTVVIFFLAYSSILGNSYYGEANIAFLSDTRGWLNGFRVLVLLCVIGGSMGSVALVWNTADLFMGMMATINLVAIMPLGGLAVALLAHYLSQRAKGIEPTFVRDELPEARNVSCWSEAERFAER
ncbi:MAG: alanine/glycine:cation symporter family protein [Bowdeniella nasicola]|nr:alanine/glycine:cation symporter family protein [Bowdeniella nasicola]